ncbi:glycosyltransferase [Candidatus Dojkabacteria bacterium]|uniref:Glycosyltransferase n=1 Tax=Candidatus Dojkabacteria bacterium TaxID=2099670 RepID=A0A955RIH8_9BACT|nr:glycosyltransferase [Candidatus Dojkabacteria bacterium]
MDKKQIQIIGPYATEYSLARVNRALGEALNKYQDEYQVRFWRSEEFTDRLPNNNDLKKYPWLTGLEDSDQNPDVYIFNNFPKSINSPYELAKFKGNNKIAYLAWEETIMPKRWIDEMNENLHGVMVTSDHVRHVFRNSGLKIPIRTVNLGIDQDLPNKAELYKLNTSKKYKFLHISSAHYRKGVDVLIKGYFETFTKDDDVVLVLKLFPNPNSKVDEIIANLRNENSPEVEIINNPDLTDGEIISLYSQCDAVVLPSRAEGFGIPMAEAMLMEKPLITTGYSGHMDFCNAENAFLLDYQLINSDSQLGTPGAKVAEPSIDDLKKHMKFLAENPDSDIVKSKVANAKKRVSELTWEKNANETLQFINEINKLAMYKNKKLVVLGPRNSTDGIAEYIKNFYTNIESSFADILYLANIDASGRVFEDDKNVKRTWEMGEKTFAETQNAISEFQPDIVHIQYHPAYFSLPDMANLISELTNKNIKVYLTPHAVQVDYIDFAANSEALNKCEKIYVHADFDKEFLNSKSLTNVELFKFGILEFNKEDRYRLRKRLGITSQHVVAIHGLIHNQKGMVEAIKAVSLLKDKYPDILLISATALNTDNITSSATYEQMQQAIRNDDLEDNVIAITDFIDTAEVIKLLQIADIVMFAYPDLKEGASGAVRKSFAALRPVVITNSHIFRDLDVGYRIENNQPEVIASAVTKLFEDQDLYNKEYQSIVDKVKNESWGIISEKYLLGLGTN